jgi:hypothetical protein
MAKLNDEHQEAAKNVTSGFAPLPEMTVHAILKDVDSTREGNKGPYWSWEFEIITDETVESPQTDEDGNPVMVKTKGRRQWNNTSLSQAWSLKQSFDAFGVGVDTDTDELTGLPVKLVLSVRTIQAGNRKGELTNNIDRVLPPDEDVAKAIKQDLKDRADMAEIF